MADILSLLGRFLLLALSLIYVRGCERLKQKVIPMLGQVLLIVMHRLVRLSAGGITVPKLQAENPGVPVPIDLATAWASVIDAAISLQFQIPWIAKARSIGSAKIRNPGGCARRAMTTGIFGRAASECSGIGS
jgi:hypothetical protein